MARRALSRSGTARTPVDECAVSRFCVGTGRPLSEAARRDLGDIQVPERGEGQGGRDRQGRDAVGQSEYVRPVPICGTRTNSSCRIKLSRLLLEFREQDSYINSDYDSSDAEDPVHKAQSAAYPITPINSITKQAFDLVQTAARHRTPWNTVPRVTLRLTRLTGQETQDSRIGETYDCLRRLGITLHFGETPEPTSAPPATSLPCLLATPKLNLDLSLLIALISDISHAPLPTDEAAAEGRFKPFDKPWKRQVDPLSGEVTVKRLQEGQAGPEEHSKALTYQLKQEMRLGLVEELNTTIAQSCAVFGVPVEEVEFWTTAEARTRCRDIVAKIGGEQERLREERLFGDIEGDFWTGSRHQGTGGPLNRFLKVQIYPDDEDDNMTGPTYDPRPRRDTFRGRLIETCDRLLSVPIEKGASVTADFLGLTLGDQSPATSDADSTHAPKKPHRGGSRRRQTPQGDTFLRVPTAHTIRSMVEGARRGMTTVTANRMSVKQILRAMGPLEALEGDEGVVAAPTSEAGEAVFCVVEPKTLGELKRSDSADLATNQSGDGQHESAGTAKFWVFEPRSLGEEVRSDGA